MAQLHLNSLASMSNRKQVSDAVERLPEGLDETYNEAMGRIRGQRKYDRELAERALPWIVNARRPLSLDELRHALAVRPGSTALDPEALDNAEIYTSICAGLVVVDNGSGVVRLVRK
jgi:hypothetical protein